MYIYIYSCIYIYIYRVYDQYMIGEKRIWGIWCSTVCVYIYIYIYIYIYTCNYMYTLP